jgi:hypothetical protein
MRDYHERAHTNRAAALIPAAAPDQIVDREFVAGQGGQWS